MIQRTGLTGVRSKRERGKVSADAELIQDVYVGPQIVHVVVERKRILRFVFEIIQSHFAGKRVRCAEEVGLTDTFIIDTIKPRHVQQKLEKCT